MSASSIGSEHRDGVIRVVTETDEIVAVCFDGDFDLTNAPTLGDQIDGVLAGGKHVIFDLSEATFIDSSIINALMRAVRVAGDRRQAMVLQLGTTTIVERVLGLVSFEHVLPRAHDRQEAVRIIQQQAEAL
jgi:anti-sigma B factor antagonist